MKKVNISLVLFLYLPFLFLFLIELMFYISQGATISHTSINHSSCILAIILFYIFYIFLYSATNNSKYSLLILSITSYIIMISSIIKIAFSENPFYLSDLLYLNNSGEIFSIIDGSIGSTLKPYILLFIISLLILVGFNILIFKYNYKNNNKIFRIVSLSITSIILLILFIPNKKLDQFIINKIYKADSRIDYELDAVSNVNYYLYNTHLGGIYGNLLESRIFIRDDYDEEEINNVLDNIPPETDKSLSKPNIIVIFSESFWDVDQLEEIEFDKPVTPNFNRLKEEGLFFDMISPSFGGLSANVEFEFLTGGSLNYFSNGYIPYMSLYKNNNKKNSPSIISELNNNDYYTKIVIYNSPKLFNCKNFYDTVKPESVEYNTDIDDKYKKGKYVSDEYITDAIIDELNNKDKDEKLFYFTTTMQSHMPYFPDKYNEYDIDIVNSDLSKYLAETVKVYAQGIYDADKELGRLYDYIQTLDEETIIVFYGDHLPFLSYYNNKILPKLDFFNTNDDKLNLYRKYNTQALVLANYNIDSLKEENKELKYLGPDLLSAYILNHMDIEISNYYKWLYSTKDIIGASNKYISINQNGELYYTDDLKDEMKKLNDFRYNVQYKYFIKE